MVLCGLCDLHKGGVYGVVCVTYIRMVLCGVCDLHKGGVGCVTYIRMVLCGGVTYIRVVCMMWGVSPT